jgi:ribosomal protein S12 methylthiotransferase accessory factor
MRSAQNSKEYWRLGRLPKYSPNGVVRCVEPRETIRRATAVLDRVGVTTVSDVTNLDRVGIPNYMTVRPRDLDPGISYYNGKGTTHADAHAGALMEAIERHAGEYCSYSIVVGSYSELRRSYTCIDPRELIVPMMRPYSEDLSLEWVCGYDLLNDRETLVPLNAVVCPYRPSDGSALFYASTNGLASGNTLIEALCHAICEVIERDAEALVMARTQIGPAARALLSTGRDDIARPTPRQIALEGLPKRARPLISMLLQAGLRVFLRDLTGTAGIATIDCTIVERGNDGVDVAYGGCGSHPDARVALLRAITEAAQSRITLIQGGREDLPEVLHQNPAVHVEDLFEGAEMVAFGDIPAVDHQYIDDDVKLMMERLPHDGLKQLVAFDLTHPDVNIPVVRVVVPLAETWTVFHLHTGRGTFGPRIAQEL